MSPNFWKALILITLVIEKFEARLYVRTHKSRTFAKNVPRLSKQINIGDNILCYTHFCFYQLKDEESTALYKDPVRTAQ